MIKTANLTGSISRNAGGLFESVRRLVQSLSATGIEVRVLGTADQHTAADIGLWSPVPVHAFRPIGPHQFAYSPRFERQLEEFAPDLVHTHGLWVYTSIATRRYCQRHGVPYVISPHGMLDPWAIRHSRWKKVIAHFLYEGAHLRKASCLRALCESEARAIRQLGLKNPIAIIPNGIDLLGEMPSAAIQTSGSDRHQELKSGKPPWDGIVKPEQKVLLFLGRIHPKKGLANLLKAWGEIQISRSKIKNSDEWVLAIAGWDQGGHEAELMSLASKLGLSWTDVRVASPNVVGQPTLVFLGPQFNIGKAACYAHCDGFILPSFSEGVPMVVLEAWAYGKAVLMTPECNLPAGLARGAAIRIETNIESIAKGLRELLIMSDLQRQTLGDAGSRLAREQFAWPQLAQEMCQLYHWLLGGGSKPACVI